MDETQVIRDQEGITPKIISYSPTWTGWFAINTDPSFIPVDREFFANYAMSDWDENLKLITTTGRFIDLDWATDPDYHRHGKPWKAHIPTKDMNGNVPCPPHLDFDRLFPYIKIHDSYRATPAHAHNMVERYSCLDHLVLECSQIDFHDRDYIAPPPSIVSAAIEFEATFYKSSSDLQRAAAAVRRGIADCMGWLYWIVAFVPESILRDRMPKDLVTRVLRETATKYRRRGSILRLSECWREVNIPLLLSQGIPIIYRWDAEEQLLPQLVRMNPKLIAGDISDGKVAIHYVEEDFELLADAKRSRNYDDFFQKKQPESAAGGHISFDLDADLFIIDFQGWRRRPVPKEVNPGMYSTYFHFRIDSSKLEGLRPSTKTTVTFWRWRKRNSGKETRMSGTALENAEMDECFIRELFKSDYAPYGEIGYDEETGLPLQDTVRYNEEVTSLESREVGREQGSELDDVNSGILEPRLAEREPPSLMVRLTLISQEPRNFASESSIASIASVSSWRNAGQHQEQKLYRGRKHIGTHPRTPTSRSSSPPRRPPSQHLTPHARPLALFKADLHGMGPHMNVSTEIKPLSLTAKWSITLLSKGHLMFPDPRSEIRFRYFANCMVRDVQQVSTLLSLAVERRLGFRIAIKKSDLPYFMPKNMSLADRLSGGSIYCQDFEEAPLEMHEPTIFSTIYVARVTELLRRPHAAAFIGMGGPYSWLAHQWGGDDLVIRFMNGPSTQTTIFNQGASDINLTNPLGLVWDEVTGADMNLLFGHIPKRKDDNHSSARWLYPPLHILEQWCDRWTGEWNWVMEHIFKFVTGKILEVPCDWKPKTGTGWKEWLRTYNGGPFKSGYILTREHFSQIFEGSGRAKLPQSWNQKPLTQICIPEEADWRR